MLKNSPCVYLLKCPVTNTVVYVGCTFNAYSRYFSHVTGSDKTHVGRWSKYLKSLGMKPKFEIIKYFNPNSETVLQRLYGLEEKQIRDHMSDYLLNCQKGPGAGGILKRFQNAINLTRKTA